MKSLKLFKQREDALGITETPVVFYVDNAQKPMYASTQLGDKVEIVIDDTEGSATIKPLRQINALKFTATDASTISWVNQGSIVAKLQKSTDGITWEDWDYSIINLADGESIYIKGDNPDGFGNNFSKYSRFTMTGSIACSGNIMYLLGEKVINVPNYAFNHMFDGCTGLTTAPELPATTLSEHCYDDMFYGCTGLTTAPELPATTLSLFCYYNMFYGCTGLTTAPELPATTLSDGCYRGMFQGCTSLTTAPELPATTLSNTCYESMFQGCTSLTIAPELPATTMVGIACYRGMFQGCTSLTTAPELPATTLSNSCYGNMFFRCTSLTTAPELPATTLSEGCYGNMFYGCTGLTTAPELPATALRKTCYSMMFNGCSKLNYIKVGATYWPDTQYNQSYTTDWLGNVSPIGTFVKPSSTKIPTGAYGIPSGWIVENV